MSKKTPALNQPAPAHRHAKGAAEEFDITKLRLDGVQPARALAPRAVDGSNHRRLSKARWW